MKRVVLFLSCLLAATSSLWAAYINYDFYAECGTGQMLYYKINADDTSVIVCSQYAYLAPYYDVYPSGDITIPAEVEFNEKTYVVTAIGSNAFRNCSGLTSVTIPNTITVIDAYAFGFCSALESIEIPTSVTVLYSNCFYNCTNLATFTIPAAVTLIGGYAFQNTAWWNEQDDGIIYKDGWCLGYKGTKPSGSLTIQDETIGIQSSAFESCSGITTLSLPESLSYIGEYAFNNCTSITDFTIPAAVTLIGGYAFQNTAWWNEQPDGIVYKDDWCLRYKGEKPYSGISIVEGTRHIANLAFSSCEDISSLALPSSLLSIGDKAFSSCYYIYTISCEVLTPPTIRANTFMGADPTIIVHANSVQAYSNAPYWNQFYVQSFSYTVTATSADDNMGSVSGSGNYGGNTTATLTATPIGNYRFVQWSDGSTDNPYQFSVVQDSNLVATFAINTYTLTINVNETMGSVEIDEEAEEYAYGTIVTLTATPEEHYHFVQWSDDNTNNPRTLTITENTELTAVFAADTYTLTVNVNDEAMGSVKIDEEAEEYAYGTEVTLTATPAAGYQFVGWSDEETEATRTITITDDIELTATFELIPEGPDAIAEANSSNAQIFGGEKRIIINNAANAMVAIYDVMGRTVVKEQRITTNNAAIVVPQRGMYIIRMGKAAKKVFVK